MKTKSRILIAFDGNRWYIRRIASIIEDGINNEKIYHCDKPLGRKSGYEFFHEIPKKYILQ